MFKRIVSFLLLLFFELTYPFRILRKAKRRQKQFELLFNSLISYRLETISTVKKAEIWAKTLGWWIPRKLRGPLIGDILEDCHQMREMNYSEWRIRTHVLWQWAIGVVTLVPVAIISAVWRIFSRSK